MMTTTRGSILGLLLLAANCNAFNVLVIGGTRFSGAYLWKELFDRGHDVTVYNRGKTSPKPVARESYDAFQARIAAATSLQGDRTSPEDLKRLIDPSKYDYVFDMNAREITDTKPLAELFVGQSNLKQYVFMSSAGVYLKSEEMPHLERDPVDPNSRHKGKLDSENCLTELGLPWCSFRPTYICGPLNYNPVERYFFERVDADRPVCIPGHGQHLTGLGHVEDLAVAMANCIGRESKTSGKVYNCQNSQAITFDGVAKAAGKVLGKEVEIIHYNPKEFTFPEGKKAFPMRPQHFFTGIHQAMEDLDWAPKYDTVEAIMRDGYLNDFVHVKAAGGLKNDFVCDDIVIEKSKVMA
ncbi:NAD-dependent epimerase/dehydratase [Nitzschia inconspicua]|uniref:NAD-dependent epimerase/dehydratase n=1 Tax=Nitzschia inconspicua TaxID=303405 RepID=A0A9K3LN65_9STRA|nr:NAD-dependent epimerase/dehydratase [Nitzschia inconspicua]